MRILIFLLSILFVQTNVFADVSEPLNFEEEDGSPSVYPYKLKLSNGSLTDNGDGTATFTLSDIACTDCVALGTETTGNYVASWWQEQL